MAYANRTWNQNRLRRETYLYGCRQWTYTGQVLDRLNMLPYPEVMTFTLTVQPFSFQSENQYSGIKLTEFVAINKNKFEIMVKDNLTG